MTIAGMTIAEALAEAQAAAVARLDAQLLLGHVLGRSRTWLLAHDDAVLTAAHAEALRALLARRCVGEPLAYIVGEREFHGLSLQVSPAVLVPRPETELLVDWAIERLTGVAGTPRVADLGTGSGAIALAIKHACPRAEVCASDASAEALQVARGNAARHGLDIDWLHGDWWSPYADRRFALALANPPYVAAADPHLADLRHEPRSALTAGADGLAALRKIVADAPVHLLPGAWLLLEHGHDQAPGVRSLLAARGYVEAETRHDLAGLPRCTGAAWPGAK